MEKAKVYFTKELTPETVIKMFQVLGKDLPGRVAVKVHSGEDGNQNYLHPEFMRPMVDYIGGRVAECNTAYDGSRSTTSRHKNLLKKHRWSLYFDVDIMDGEGPDLELPVTGGTFLKGDLVGKDLADYDSLLVLSHFKGHPMGGFGGALKQLSIGCASAAGKARIHSAGKTDDTGECWIVETQQDDFVDSMAEAAQAVVNFFKGNAAYVSMVCNLSVDCDCCSIAEDPCMGDIGILSSTDPVALDQACLDLIKKSDDPGRDHFMERVTSRNGERILETAVKLGYGSREYDLICVD